MKRGVFVNICLAVAVAADSYFFTNNTLGPNARPVSTACSTALLASIDCAKDLIDFAQSDYYGPLSNLTLQNSICDPACGAALSAYQSSVTAACASDPQPFPGLPATYFGDVIHATFSLFCMKDDTTGQYCVDYFDDLFANSTTDQDITDLVVGNELCSPCIVNSFKQMQSTPYSNYDDHLASVWSSIQDSCNLSFNTTVPNIVTNVTLPDYAPPGSAYSGKCLSGNFYTVQGGDNCKTISIAHNVGTGTLAAVNNLLKNCTDISAGRSLCLPQTCTTYTVQPGDTCASISLAHNLLYQEVLAYNPTLNAYCTNLVIGDLICVSRPGGATWTGTPIPSATVTQTAIYATATVSPPANMAQGTTTHCGQYYTVNSDDFCQVIAVNFTISLALFEEINPSLNADCTNLVVGLAYCVFPTVDWNNTMSSTSGLSTSQPSTSGLPTNQLSTSGSPTSQPSTSSSPITSTTVAPPSTLTTVAPPGATASGTTNQCFGWYIVKSGDSCLKIESQFGITFTQFQSWNPVVRTDCTNIFVGEAYCVNGPGQPSISSSVSTTSTSTTHPNTLSTVAPPGPTPSGTTNQCFRWYVVKSGDSCPKIETQFGITFTQFQSWNPAVRADCTNIFAGEAYCVNGPGQPSTSSPVSTTASTTTTHPSTLTTVAPPGPTPSGTTNQCFKWYTVKSGDSCLKIEAQFGITFTQFQLWNPAVRTDCTNIFVGESYCVSGANQPATMQRVSAAKQQTGGLPIGWPYPIWRGIPGIAVL